MAAKKTTPAAKATKATATATLSADPFDTLTIAAAPAPTRAKAAPPAITPGIRAFAATLIKEGPQYVSVAGWNEDKVKLFEKTLRGNRAELFPEMRIRITPVETTTGPAFHISLGRLGNRITR